MQDLVLIVEDDPSLCVLLQAVLRRRGLPCEVVHDGNEAISRLRRNVYHAVLLDIMLPGAFGFDVIQFLRAERPWMLPRVIVMTAACEETLRFFDASQVHVLLHKPLELHELAHHLDLCTALDKISSTRAPSASPI